ncbi:MAG: HyaD/HybD family hydrogenase maturation endopeptidase [candidate division KSB1 bacterium]|nr:HyaD/HybD family hydrogenase maturation endopeptidase [candidate division KSB1 bacterium]MDZ7274114.1 HyaD/HybD family hydrogenase maturation endopeptidase [candidate division KSB1 bacterium]MDZ7287842.1 HyaD/HybD family hydrogenase maturation endopeptidase [candidate division KSB1 bacterium]MDZ7296712.1 HyaD/HybD family hydrogenase maturation endopeptidase [candidate division KSB1 bacterium]MDZ7309568.1 HyaD/HybD family hydrogenase maturation endopeptidase [candidate division KSB1 bacterium
MPAFNHASAPKVLILGIGNVLLGDEGIGVHVVQHLQNMPLPEGVACLDGGTGSFNLLEPMQQAGKVILIDAIMDGAPAGTVRRHRPRFSQDYPRTLTAHDIGLKDLLDAFYLLGNPPEVILYAVSISALQGVGTELSPELATVIPQVAQLVLAESAS